MFSCNLRSGLAGQPSIFPDISGQMRRGQRLFCTLFRWPERESQDTYFVMSYVNAYY
ncbi:hypothetical protein SAMN05443144_11237 [Fodinibius roseus]|uniref:Uncharacterized protein n=1 Tax=Fodinibius roseus TaxID=1194090 RepID=A0A1M5DUR8_9BACT|nr:hypothetical protein SAMN05443144_11237 [Fodinibius roseus]